MGYQTFFLHHLKAKMESKLQVQVKMYCSEDGSSYQVNMKFIYLFF